MESEAWKLNPQEKLLANFWTLLLYAGSPEFPWDFPRCFVSSAWRRFSGEIGQQNKIFTREISQQSFFAVYICILLYVMYSFAGPKANSSWIGCF